MKEILISQFIDDELTLSEKKEFVVNVKVDDTFYSETIEMLDSEILFRDKLNKKTPPQFHVEKYRGSRKFIHLAVAALFFIGLAFLGSKITANKPEAVSKNNIQKEYRFVIYNDSASNVELSGTFTNWHKIPMKRINNSNYWEITVPLTKGEHKYAIIADGQVLADPTSAFIEQDDFGNINSVLEV
ncbi:glycogen-binding domain-containing protein [Deferribacteraceae bacterium V6Fe1]|nr:glycogen-binding domain-containing protein [Deferribacteraceae bacterium V6Fe1]